MSTMTIGTATETRPSNDTPSQAPAFASTAERRARALAPTVFCPSSQVDECLEGSQVRRHS